MADKRTPEQVVVNGLRERVDELRRIVGTTEDSTDRPWSDWDTGTDPPEVANGGESSAYGSGQVATDGESLDALSWHVQRILYEMWSAEIVYGPLRSGWSAFDGEIIAAGNWRLGIREPLPALKDEWGTDPEQWPTAAACSTMAALFVGAYIDAGDTYDPKWGRSISKALKNDWKPLAVDAHKRRWRVWEWDRLPAFLPASVSVALYRGHVVVVLDCDALELCHPGTGDSLRGAWVLASDGWFRDRDGVRYYNAQPMRFEPATERAQREGGRSIKARRFALVGIKAPSVIPHKPRLAVA
jgi:hypothetical protein